MNEEILRLLGRICRINQMEAPEEEKERLKKLALDDILSRGENCV